MKHIKTFELKRTMKLWLLRPVEDLSEGDNPWKPWYDKAFGFVIRAETEEEAREMAHNKGGEEIVDTATPWKDPRYSTCVELLPAGPAGVVIEDFHAA